jgi:hypothetical protein
MDADRRCGTCRYFEFYDEDIDTKGACLWGDSDTLKPEWAVMHQPEVDAEEGTDCPTWEAKPDV